MNNKEVPYYYGKFRDDVISGKIMVNEMVSLEMNRIDRLIEDPNYYYDRSRVEGYIKFCESELTLTDGEDLKLLDSFKLWAEQLLGWYYFINRKIFVPDNNGGGYYKNIKIKKRLVNKQYLIIARGAAKTMYLDTIHSYFLNVFTKTTWQVHVAPTVRLAETCLLPIKTSITRSRGPLYKFLTNGSINNTTGSVANRVKLASTKKGIENFISNSLLEIRPMSIDKLQGLNSLVNSVDEWLSCDIREDVIGAIEQGASKNEDYIIVATSSEGTVRNGPGDSIKMELNSILRNDYYNPHVSIWWYKLDDIKEVSDPSKWIKANPNIGLTVSYETYQQDVEKAEKVPSSRNDILAKRFGIPTEGYTYFFTYEETLPSKFREYHELPCSLGIDLSQGDDFCTFMFLFPLPNGLFGTKSINYITERSLHKVKAAMRLKYEEFIEEGSLVIMPGNILDMDLVYDNLNEYINKKKYDVRSLGYDPYNAKYFIDKWMSDYGPYNIDKIIQGVKSETVPLGEIKKISEDKELLFDQKIISYAMGNAIVMEDTNGNRKLLKKRYEDKIDPVAALINAWASYKNNKDNY